MNNHLPSNLAYENGEVVSLADSGAGDELIVRAAARCGISTGQAAQAMEFYDEHFASSTNMTAGNLAEGLRQRDLQWWFSIEKILDLLIDYQTKQDDMDSKYVRMSTRAMALALGFRLTAVGSDDGTPASLARVMGLQKMMGTSGKFTVSKCLERFIAQLKLAKIPGQRDEQARENMRAAANKRSATADKDIAAKKHKRTQKIPQKLDLKLKDKLVNG